MEESAELVSRYCRYCTSERTYRRGEGGKSLVRYPGSDIRLGREKNKKCEDITCDEQYIYYKIYTYDRISGAFPSTAVRFCPPQKRVL